MVTNTVTIWGKGGLKEEGGGGDGEDDDGDTKEDEVDDGYHSIIQEASTTSIASSNQMGVGRVDPLYGIGSSSSFHVEFVDGFYWIWMMVDESSYYHPFAINAKIGFLQRLIQDYGLISFNPFNPISV